MTVTAEPLARGAVSPAAVEGAVGRAERWIWSMQAPGRTKGIFRFSAQHDPMAWPGVLLPGTYNALCCLALTGGVDGLDADARRLLGVFLRGFQRDDGVFRITGMHDEDVHKNGDQAETWRYIDFHVTNYTLGALEAIDALDPLRLDFVRPYLDSETLDGWLASRDMGEPWQEGNSVVNLASFLLLLRDHGAAAEAGAAGAALERMLDWHDATQDPATGFWVDGASTDEARLHAMAGATHNLHLYYRLGRPVPRARVMTDYCLSLDPAASTACLDVDPVDILAALTRFDDYRRADIEGWLARKLEAVLARQNEDGGFGDATDGTLRLDGWVRGYAEPQGISNTFATWFRVLTIAHIARLLWPDWRRWGFRRMVGIGYAPE